MSVEHFKTATCRWSEAHNGRCRAQGVEKVGYFWYCIKHRGAVIHNRNLLARGFFGEMDNEKGIFYSRVAVNLRTSGKSADAYGHVDLGRYPELERHNL